MRRGDLRLVDAVDVELAAQVDAPLITTDPRLARAALCPTDLVRRARDARTTWAHTPAESTSAARPAGSVRRHA